MRRVLSALTVAAGVPVFLVVPVLGRPAVRPHPVTPYVEAVAVPAVPQPVPAAPRPGAADVGVLARVTIDRAHSFDLVGATWRSGTLDPGAATVQVRVHRHGRWSGWNALTPQDGGADGGSADALRAARVHATTQAAEPMWVGASDGVQARVVGAAGGGVAPSDLKVVLVDGGSSPADADPAPAPVLGGGIASAAESKPRIYTRAQWGADESLRRHACPGGPDYAPTVRMGFIHHTDGGNGYTRSQVPAIIRSIYAYHVKSNGWCDVGYNYLVDKFGRIWEGRYGGVTKPVLGAHTGGFNYESFGAALIGTFTSTRPSSAMRHAVQRLFAWRLGRYYLDPLGASTLTASAFSGSRYRAGTDVTFKTVSGHRDADYTDCPGGAAYGELPEIRAGIARAMGAGFVSPSVSTSAVPMAGGVVDVTAGVVGPQSWRLSIADADGVTVRTYTGDADRSHRVDAAWDLTATPAVPVLPGRYTLRLTGTDAHGAAARPWTTTVTVTPPVSLHVPRQTGFGTAVTPHGKAVPGHLVSVAVTTPQGPQQVGTFRASRSGRWTAGAVTVTVDRDLTWRVSDGAAPGYTRSKRTRVGPVLTAPQQPTTFVDAGAALAVRGTALPLPGARVTLMTQPDGAGVPVAGPSVPVAADGTWSTSLTPATATRFWVADGRGLAAAAKLVYPVPAPTATAPGSGYAGRKVVVSGDAGAPVAVSLSVRSGNRWSLVRTVTAATDGRFHVRLPLADGAAGSTVPWRVSSGHGSPATGAVVVRKVFAPTATGPARIRWGASADLTGVAVPGDVVTVRTAPAGTSRWSVAGTARASADKTWTLPVRFTRDTQWQVTSASGTSAIGNTVVHPTIHGPASVRAGTRVVLHGRAVPGSAVTLFGRPDGATTWSAKRTVRAGTDGRWQVVRHPPRTASFRVRSDEHSSRAVTVVVA